MKRFWIILLLLTLVSGAIFYLKGRAHRVSVPAGPEKKILASEKPLPKAAIVLDDWGYNMNNIDLLNSIEIPLTVSVLPNLAYSRKISTAQNGRRNREVIIHIPIEPESDSIPLEKNTLLTSMDRKEVIDILNKALNTVPYAKGASNHMGSKGTRDSRLMGIIMEQLKAKGLYFLDSVAAAGTVCKEESEKADIRFVKRDIFLDNIADKDYISSQMDKLKRAAIRKGRAVGIGHDRELTLQVIKEKSEGMKKLGIEFVLLSELVKESGDQTEPLK